MFLYIKKCQNNTLLRHLHIMLFCFTFARQKPVLQAQTEKLKAVGQSVAVALKGKGGKSGQRRALHFLTESCLRRQSNAEENNRPQG